MFTVLSEITKNTNKYTFITNNPYNLEYIPPRTAIHPDWETKAGTERVVSNVVDALLPEEEGLLLGWCSAKAQLSRPFGRSRSLLRRSTLGETDSCEDWEEEEHGRDDGDWQQS